MSSQKHWYDADDADEIRVIPRAHREFSYVSVRWRHPRVMPGIGECLLYPLSDGPGLGLLVLFPPVLWIFSLPVFDLIAIMQPLTKGQWALGLLVLPIFLPLLFGFAMIFGYILLFFGHVLVASAVGENDHPRWPEWHPSEISEGIGRWAWAVLFGAAMIVLPAFGCWKYFGKANWLSGIVMGSLFLVGTGIAQMALAAALVHETIVAANPFTVGVAIIRIGWRYAIPSVVGSVALASVVLGIYGLLFRLPKMWMEAVSLWGFWVLLLYLGMVVMRMLGLTYHAHAVDLVWFRRRPRWASTRLDTQIYANS